MDRDLLAHLPVVVAVAERGGFASAARALGSTPSNVSHSVRLVEDRLGAPLFNRTTRSVSPTREGEALLAAIAPALRDIDDAWERAAARESGAAGLVRINAPRIALALGLTAVIALMRRRHPGVTVEAHIDNALTDIVAAGFDAGVRVGEMIARDMVAVRLTEPLTAVIVASPDYLARSGGPPRTIADLGDHACIGFRQTTGGGIYRWDLMEDGRAVRVETPSAALVNDPSHAVDLALAGVGLAYVFKPLVADALADGRLVRVLPEASVVESGLFLYFPRGAAGAPKMRALIDTARDRLRRAGSGVPDGMNREAHVGEGQDPFEGGAREEVALHQFDAEIEQDRGLTRGLHTLGDRNGAEIAAQVERAGHDQPSNPIGVDSPDQVHVELDEVRLEFDQQIEP